jgi:hypothetical protein
MSREFEKLDNSCNIFIFNDNNYSYYKPFIDFTHINKLNKKLAFKKYSNIYIDSIEYQKKNASNLVKSFNDISCYINSFIKTEKDFLLIKSKSQKEDIEYINNAVYLLNITITRDNKHRVPPSRSHYLCMTHVMLDYYNQIHFFYKLLLNNQNYSIIIDLPVDKKIYGQVFEMTDGRLETIKKFIKYLRDIKLKNDIVTLWDKKILINNLYTIRYNENRGIFNQLSLQNMTTPFCNFNNIIDISNTNYKLYNKKFLILEVRPKSNRGIPKTINNEIIELCQMYCKKNNLNLILWDFEYISKKSIYEQFEISYNAEIIITYGGSMTYFCHTIQKGSVLILNMSHETGETNIYTREFLMNVCFYNYSQFYKKKNVNTFIKFLNPQKKGKDILYLPKIINDFFTKQ